MYDHNTGTYQGPLETKIVVSDVVNAALVALIWSESRTDEEGNDLGNYDDDYGPEDATQELAQRIADELETVPTDLLDEYLVKGTADQFGHDMTLTRNGHGAGFWDRGLGELGDKLTDWAKTLSEINAFDDFVSDVPAEWEGKFHAE